MTYLFDFPNATNPDSILIQTATEIPSLIPFFLLFVWGFVFFGGTARQKARIGIADYPMWSVVASLSILIISALIALKPGLIGVDILVIVFVITVACGIWLFLDRRISEG